MLLASLRRANPGLRVFDTADADFSPYGTSLAGDWSAMVGALERYAPIPDEGVSYVASCAELEADPAGAGLMATAYGGIAAQIGYCSGRNSRMNGMEYHRASEILVAADDLVLLLGLRGELERAPEGTFFDSARAKALLVRRGEAVELFSGTLHLAPCRVLPGGFRAAIVLPRLTNAEFGQGTRPSGDATLLKRNKWILAHPERAVLLAQGAVPGIRGPNIELVPPDAREGAEP